MNIINSEDFIGSIAQSLQYINCYHPLDFVRALSQAYRKEINKSAKNALGQILINSRMCAISRRPICQDTGIVTAFVKIGMDCRFDTHMTIQEMVDKGVETAYGDTNNPLRKSIVWPPSNGRNNTTNNTPAIVYTDFVEGNSLEVKIAAKGGGSENKSKFAMLNPTDSITNWITQVIPKMGAGWCPPGILGIGIGGTLDKAMYLAKEALMEPVDIQDLLKKGPSSYLEELRLDIYNRVNSLGIGAQGLGGLTTVLDVKIVEYPTHAASLPVAVIPNCAATRHTNFKLDGSGPANFYPPDLDAWPAIHFNYSDGSKRVFLDQLSQNERSSWKAGQTLLLNGKILTGRDAAHNRIKTHFDEGKPLPLGLNFNGRFIYYVGPVDPILDEVVGPAGPTTSGRMDKYTEMMLEKVGIVGMIGKSERNADTIDLIKKHKAVYLIACGGAAYLISKTIKRSSIIAFEDLGMEAIYEFEVEDMPVIVAVDSNGNAIHETGPTFWKNEMARYENKFKSF